MTAENHSPPPPSDEDTHRLPVFRPEGTVLDIREEYVAALDRAERTLDYRFAERRLLLEALLHPSMREREDASYERLEFLGDAVLGLVIAEHLFERFPDSAEGELTRIKSMVVSRASLARLGRHLQLTDLLLLGKGMLGQGAISRAVLSNAVEALIGALYLDGGYEQARRFILRHLGARIDRSIARRDAVNHKSLLQQLTQRHAMGTPTYEVLATRGPDHECSFEIRAWVQDRAFEPAAGSSKKSAEQKAARIALRVLESELDDTSPSAS